MIIKNKKEFYDLSSRGLCGNTARLWNSVDEYWTDRNRFPIVSIRRLISGSSRIVPYVHYSDIGHLLSGIEDEFVINEIPTGARIIQGELSILNGEYYLYYTNIGGYMREALRFGGISVIGSEVNRLLCNYCDSQDYGDLMDLLDIYSDVNYHIPYPVIEFSVLNDNAGIFNRRLYIWEVRNY